MQLPETLNDLISVWVTALRSGKYKQGKGSLCDLSSGEAQYCCLGVLCDVLGLPSTVRNVGGGKTLRAYGDSSEGDDSDAYLPNDIGIQYQIGNSPRLNNGTELSVLNDDYGATFDDIATLLETDGIAIRHR